VSAAGIRWPIGDPADFERQLATSVERAA